MSVTRHRASPNGKGVKKIHAVEETSHAVEESYPAVGRFFHGFLFLRVGVPLLRLAAPPKIDAT